MNRLPLIVTFVVVAALLGAGLSVRIAYERQVERDLIALGASMTTVPRCADGDVAIWNADKAAVECAPGVIIEPAGDLVIGSGKTLEIQPCFAGDVGATFREATYAVTTIDAAEVLAAESLRQVREQCPKDAECKVISIQVRYTETKK